MQERPLKEVIQHIEQLTLSLPVVEQKFVSKPGFPILNYPISLLSALREALPQLIRNAVAHGIEAREERQR